MSKFIFLTSDKRKTSSILNYINSLHLIDSVILHEEKAKVVVIVPNIFAEHKKIILTQKNSSNFTKNLFPDKLNDLKNYTLKIYSLHDPPFFMINANEMICEFCGFLEIVENKLKVKLEYHDILHDKNENTMENVREMHFINFKILLKFTSPSIIV